MISDKIMHRRPAELGSLKIGGLSDKARTSKEGNTWYAPEAHPYFTITHRAKDKAGKAMINVEAMEKAKAWAGAMVDGDLRNIRILVISDNIEESLYSSLSLYTKKERICAGTGGGEEVEFKTQDGVGKRKCPCHLYKPEGGGQCKPYGVFSFVLVDDYQMGAVHRFRTTSMESIRNIETCLKEVKLKTGGVLDLGFRFPYTLKMVQKPGKFGPVWVLVLVMPLDYEKLIAATVHTNDLRSQVGYKAAIPASFNPVTDETEDDIRGIKDEYYPEENVEDAVIIPDDHATDDQEKQLIELCEKVYGDPDSYLELLEGYKIPKGQLTSTKADSIIKLLEKRLQKEDPVEEPHYEAVDTRQSNNNKL